MTIRGPLDKQRALAAVADAIANATHPPALDWWYELVERGLRDALSSYTAAPWQVNGSSSK